jgi:glycosyltransferase involved in cell wall biosynthesis
VDAAGSVGNTSINPHRAPAVGDLSVAMTIQRFAPVIGGAELQLERLLPELTVRGVQARVLTRAVHGAAPKMVAGNVPVRRSSASGEGAGASLAFTAASFADVVRHRRTTDVVHAHGALSPATIGLAAIRIGIPCVVTPLGAGPPGDIARLRQKPGGRRRLDMLARHAFFIALSDEIRAELRDAGVPPERIRLVPNGVDAAKYRPASSKEQAQLRSALGMRSGSCAVFVGRLHPVKNLPTLLRAIALTSDIDLAVVGDGTERSALENLARELGIDGRVQFVGASERVDDYLRAADAFVLPSIAEGMSNALAEAMACGLACVASSSAAGVRGLFEGGRGVTADPNDARSWADALTELSIDPIRRRALGDAAAGYVHAELSLANTADQLTALYHEIARR